jgi:hypothetical protein
MQEKPPKWAAFSDIVYVFRFSTFFMAEGRFILHAPPGEYN